MDDPTAADPARELVQEHGVLMRWLSALQDKMSAITLEHARQVEQLQREIMQLRAKTPHFSNEIGPQPSPNMRD